MFVQFYRYDVLNLSDRVDEQNSNIQVPVSEKKCNLSAALFWKHIFTAEELFIYPKQTIFESCNKHSRISTDVFFFSESWNEENREGKKSGEKM